MPIEKQKLNLVQLRDIFSDVHINVDETKTLEYLATLDDKHVINLIHLIEKKWSL